VKDPGERDDTASGRAWPNEAGGAPGTGAARVAHQRGVTRLAELLIWLR